MKRLVPVLFLLCALGPALADGRDDWRGYDWKETRFGTCLADAAGWCHAHHAKWDWKRDQWVDVFFLVEKGGITVQQRLTNNDRNDTDFVCITVLLLDSEGRNLGAYHRNEEIGPGKTLEHRQVLDVSGEISRVAIGSKQCRDGAGQDEAVLAGVLSLMGQR